METGIYKDKKDREYIIIGYGINTETGEVSAYYSDREQTTRFITPVNKLKERGFTLIQNVVFSRMPL